MFGTPEQQKQRFLEPLVAGETRSFFGMTEPEVAGSDPTLLRGRAVRDGDDWVINAHKWFSSGADGAGFGVVMVVTDPDAEPHRRASMILVPTDTPGYELVRKRPGDGARGPRLGARTARRASPTCAFRVENMLGEPGDGFRIAQKRLGPGRIHHVMRWLGQMQRAFELMCSYSLERKAFGEALAEQADDPELDRRVGGRHPGVPPDDAAGRAAARRRRRGARRGLADQVLRRARAERGDRPRAAGARRPRHDRRHAARRACGGMARGARIYDGADEVHKMVVARRILRAFEDGGTWRFT